MSEAAAGARVRQIALPLVATAAVAVWIASGVDRAALGAAFERADLRAAACAVGAYCVLFLVLDVVSFGLGYRLFLDPATPWRDILKVRGASTILQVALAPLAPVVPCAYFRLRRGIGIARTLGSELFVIFCDGYCEAALLAAGLLLTGASLGWGWSVFPIAMAVLLAVVWLYYLTPLRDRIWPRVRDAELLHAFAQSGLRHYLGFFAIRCFVAAANVAVFWALLRAFGVQLAPAQLVLLVPVMMIGTFLPTSAGGYGAPQGAAVLLLANVFEATTPETALAFSLVWSTAFAIGRAVVGAPFLIASWPLIAQRGGGAGTTVTTPDATLTSTGSEPSRSTV